MQVHKGAAQLAHACARLRFGQLLFIGLRPDDALLLLLDEEVIELLEILPQPTAMCQWCVVMLKCWVVIFIADEGLLLQNVKSGMSLTDLFG